MIKPRDEMGEIHLAQRSYSRRDALKLGGGAVLGAARLCRPEGVAAQPESSPGVVVGHLHAAKAGMDVLSAGGNAVDAAVAAGLAAAVSSVQMCGIGGFGGHLVIALPGGKKVTAIDFNTAAPAAARPDMFPLNDQGGVKGEVNTYGWLAVGVPGTLAGLQLALNRYGTIPLRKVIQPALGLARDGFEVSDTFALATREYRGHLVKDAASARLLLDEGTPLERGKTFRNPELADLLETLAKRNSVDSFYRGDIGERIASEFQKNGGLVTTDDLAAYRAREVEPSVLNWRGYAIHTAPPTAGGLTVLQALSTLKALGWEQQAADDPATTQALLETLRFAWNDRLTLLGDPLKVDVPIARLLSDDYARQSAEKVNKAVQQKRPIAGSTDGQSAHGTVHLSAVDRRGMMVALTLTHGGSFGACVTVEGLGLILGHGMSRFDPRPGKPNSPAPDKRPLHNMCPTVVLRGGQPLYCLGAVGGRRIPNAVFNVLAHLVGRDASLDAAVAAPRLHTEGDLNVTAESAWPEASLDRLKEAGYKVKTGAVATLNAVAFDASSGHCRSAAR
jgi:gamma-glutamyltranspeptidase/glutathione hydrolase